MRIGTKIATGYVLLIILMLALQLYQLSTISHMRDVDRQLAEINFESARASLRLMRDLEQFEEFTQKYLQTGDPNYGSQLRPMRLTFGEDLGEVASLDLSDPVHTEVKRLLSIWENFQQDFALVEAAYEEGLPGRLEEITPGLMQYFGQMRLQMEHIIHDSREAVIEKVNRSRVLSERAEWVSWGAVIIGIALSFMVSIFIVRSITRPLNQLTAGVRKITQGNFSFYVDDSGNDEFAELGHHFNIMVQRLRELDELKKDFVSHVSHELKAPLASMLETTNLMLEEIPGEVNEKQERLLRLNLRSGKRLFSMINNLLDLSIIEAGAMQYDFEIENVVKIINRVVDEYQGLYLEKQIEIQTAFPEEPVLVKCDEQRLIQVFGNLFANAVNFSHNGSTIRIEVKRQGGLPPSLPDHADRSLDTAGRNYCLISFFDQGPGVPDQHKERIFEKFHEVKQGKKITGQGTGLGLPISQSIIDAHRGAIWIEDNPKGGSIFSVLLRVVEGT